MPYQPGIEYRGDQYLFQGISQAGAGVAEGIKQWREENKQRKKVDATFDAVAGGLGKMVEAGLLPAGTLKQFSELQKGPTEAKMGALQGAGELFKMFQQVDEAGRQNKQLGVVAEQLKLAQEAQQNDTSKTSALLGAQERQKAAGSRIAEFLTERPGMAVNLDASGRAFKSPRPGTTPAMVGGKPAGELTPEAALRLTGDALTPEGFVQLTGMAQREGAGRPEAMTIDMPDGTKVQGIWTRVQGFQPVAKDNADPKATVVYRDEEGNPLFYGLQTGKGGIEWKPANPKMVPVKGMNGLFTYGNRIFQADPTKQMLFELMPGYGGMTPGASGGFAPSPSPTTPGRTIPKYDQQGNRLN